MERPLTASEPEITTIGSHAKDKPPREDPEKVEIVELSVGVRSFLDIIVKRMIEETFNKYYQENNSCETRWNSQQG